MDNLLAWQMFGQRPSCRLDGLFGGAGIAAIRCAWSSSSVSIASSSCSMVRPILFEERPN